jgi:hypothetical protein
MANDKDLEAAAVCGLCGKPMPEGEEMFNYHGFSGPCPPPDIHSEVFEAAKQWLESNTKIRWTTEPGPGEEGITLEELNRRPNKYAGWLSNFAASMVAAEREAAAREERKRIADELEDALQEYNDRDKLMAVNNVIESLREEASPQVTDTHVMRWEPCTIGGVAVCVNCDRGYACPPWTLLTASAEPCEPKEPKL